MKCVFLCEKGARENDYDLRQVSTSETDVAVTTIITELNDSRLLVRKLSWNESKVSPKCLIELKNRYRSHVRKSNKEKQNIDENVCNSRVFVELANYVKKEVNSGKLHSLYESRLGDVGKCEISKQDRAKGSLLGILQGSSRTVRRQEQFLSFQSRNA